MMNRWVIMRFWWVMRDWRWRFMMNRWMIFRLWRRWRWRIFVTNISYESGVMYIINMVFDMLYPAIR